MSAPVSVHARALVVLGVRVVEIVPVEVAATPWSAGYLEAKRVRMEHRLRPAA